MPGALSRNMPLPLAPLLVDGATGTQLAGSGTCEELNLADPKKVTENHIAFLQAGCDAVETNTFCAAPHVLRKRGLEHEMEAINRAAVQAARLAAPGRGAAQRRVFVLGSLGPGHACSMSAGELRASYYGQAEVLAQCGVDAFLLETLQDLETATAAVAGINQARTKNAADTPLFVSLSPAADGNLADGMTLREAILRLRDMPIDLLALNCGTGPLTMRAPLSILAREWPRLTGCLPSAGLPQVIDGRAVYPCNALEFATALVGLQKEFQLDLIGGCCGATPAHMRATRTLLEG